ncbi:MAG TPA: VWA domain-containing protein [Terriglobales bacterium]|nr:VWA domain-containing protein [Terriglobales bacterium]
MSRLSFRDFCETSLRALWLNAIFHKKHIRGFRERERAEIVKNDSSVRMRRLVLFLAVAVATSPAQVPKPPWATGNSTTAKPNSTDSKNNAGPDNAAASTQASETTLKVDVKLVNVFVTVTDEHGAPVGGLKRENFTLLEDGKPQTISMFDKESALPLSIVVDVDTSLSTRKDLPLELSSARRFAHAILRPVDALSLYGFSEVVSEVVPFTSDLKTIDRGVDRVRLGSATALYDALYLGAQALAPRKGRKVLVVITDGGDTVSRMDYKQAVRSAQEAEAIVYSIIVVPIEASAGRDIGGEHALIQISEDTGGKYFYATSVPELDDAFRKISDELRTQYLLAYYPSQRLSDSSFRRIEVKVDGVPTGSKFTVRHRTGYYTSKSKL